jgi:poly(A) polymerase
MLSSNLRSDLRPISRAILSEGVEAYLVGGVVRDSLLGRESPDVDVVVRTDTATLGRRLAQSLSARFVPLDRQRGIVRLLLSGRGGARTVDLKPMDAGILEDLSQRDFSCDAMAVPLAEADAVRTQEAVIDPHGGISDLRAGVVRSIAGSVFTEDPGRLMRAPRLAAQLGFTISKDTEGQIRSHANLLRRVSPERTRDELLKLLAAPRATASIRLLDRLGLLSQALPELDLSRGVSQPKEHHWDVFNHLLETPGQLERLLGPDQGLDIPRFDGMETYFAEPVSDGHTRLTLLKLACLLHDVSKPETKTVESSGRIRFLGHHTKGAEVAEGIARRLRISGRGVELVRLEVRHHLRPGQMAAEGELPSGKAVYRYFRDVGDAAIDTLYLNMADHLAARGPFMGEGEWSDRKGTIRHILRQGLEQRVPDSLPQLLDGNDIMECLSLEPGPEIGHILDLIQEAQANGEVTTKGEAIQLIKSDLQVGRPSA